MPRPTRDFNLLIENEIKKITLKIARLGDQRDKLLKAHAMMVSGDAEGNEMRGFRDNGATSGVAGQKVVAGSR